MATSGEELLAGTPRNYLRGCLLLLIGEAPAHGYDLLEQIGELGFAGVDPGGVYRALRAMEQEGLVASTWEPSTSGPARRTYALTAAGRRSLDGWARALRERVAYLTALLDRYDHPAEDPSGDRGRTRS